MAIVAVSITPVGTADTSVSRFVAAAERELRADPQLRVRLDPMFTTLEGELDRILAAVRRAQEAVFDAGAQRVSTVIKVDDRRDRPSSMEGKLQAVEVRLAAGPVVPSPGTEA